MITRERKEENQGMGERCEDGKRCREQCQQLRNFSKPEAEAGGKQAI